MSTTELEQINTHAEALSDLAARLGEQLEEVRLELALLRGQLEGAEG